MSQLFGMDFLNLNNRINQVNKNIEKTENTRNTIGKPEISDTASSYYESLKAKFGDAEFVLIDDEHAANAKEYAANVNTDKEMIVLISESELEAMASDEATRTKNEQLISDGLAQMPGLKEQLEESGVEVKSFGMEFNDDGTLSYFAVLDKSAEAQKERIENIREEKKAEAEKAREPQKKENLTTITASSMEELIKKIKDTMYEAKADNILTEQEKMVGQHFDLKF